MISQLTTRPFCQAPAISWLFHNGLPGFVLLFFVTIGAQGQPLRGGAGFLYGGPSLWPGAANAIQTVSKATGNPGNDQYLLVGGEAYVRQNRWLFGVNASALINKRIQNPTTLASLESSASNLHVWVGWIVWGTNRAKLYPSVGPGLNSFNVNATTATGVARTYALDGFATDLGLTFDWLVLKAQAGPGLYAGPMVSLRVGYRLTTASAEWHGDQNGTTLLLADRYAPRGFYLTLGIGGGGFRHP